MYIVVELLHTAPVQQFIRYCTVYIVVELLQTVYVQQFRLYCSVYISSRTPPCLVCTTIIVLSAHCLVVEPVQPVPVQQFCWYCTQYTVHTVWYTFIYCKDMLTVIVNSSPFSGEAETSRTTCYS